MKLETINQLLEKLSTTDFIQIEKEHYELMKKEMKKNNNKRYYENHKCRIIAHNAETLKNRYENDVVFKEKMKIKNKEIYLKKKESQNIKSREPPPGSLANPPGL